MHYTASMARKGWTRDELILTFNLYCKIPFGKIHYRNPAVIELSLLIGRTPSAIAWKLANFARLDPTLRERGIKGAGHGSEREIEIWQEFNSNWDALAFESEHLLRAMQVHHSAPRTVEETAEEELFPEGRTRETITKARVNQAFFRSAVLASYDERCCISRIATRDLLVASHIVPWSQDAANRTNPRNGLCLSALHDRAFDCGLITITPELKVRVSPSLRQAAKRDPSLVDFILRYEDSRISVPSRFVPERDFLAYHNEKVFRKT
jgi:putative restriction endonuclease